MHYSSQGFLWRLRQSWWILLAFIPYVYFAGLLYIAIRVRRVRWGVWSAVYALPLLYIYFIADGTLTFFPIFCLIVAWISCIIHTLRARKEFLSRLEDQLLLNGSVQVDLVLRFEDEDEPSNEAPYERGWNSAYDDRPARRTDPNEFRQAAPGQSFSEPPSLFREPRTTSGEAVDAIFRRDDSNSVAPASFPSAPSSTASASSRTVELNSATEQELAELPGIGLVLAKKAVQERLACGGFQSFEQFCTATGLKPHIVERIRPLVAVQAPASKSVPASSGRVIDF
ncbi:helix-hairpin-helix domain-containing protein [Paenibacillus albicereus]|uniref:Helix-hairpin-helix domain-containing protein n=1 Tax=Paenibacillus albicereus TaxID=2726185 RepID=A0A6H2GS93_9BACL|nr:helix-hairpin-helix domain-containing protein [Paenibacillus albicereus]QJC50284.1 helix-hairpin-helix domain-containing protein [Paenibacillus albicereus]